METLVNIIEQNEGHSCSEESFDLKSHGAIIFYTGFGCGSGFGGGGFGKGSSFGSGGFGGFDIRDPIAKLYDTEDKPDPYGPLLTKTIETSLSFKMPEIASNYGAGGTFLDHWIKQTTDQISSSLYNTPSSLGSAGDFRKGKAPYSLTESVCGIDFQYRAGEHERFGEDHVNIDLISPIDNRTILEKLHIDWNDKKDKNKLW